MAIQAKSVYDPPAPDDGVRVLTTNYWPRGINRERAGVYKRVLAPDRAALRAFKAGALDWPTYRRMYIDLMHGESQVEAISKIANLARLDTVTVMCACRNTVECHSILLKELVEEAIAAR